MLRALVEQHPGRFLLVIVNTDEQKALADRLGVNNLPALMLFRNGKEVEAFHGARPQNDYPAMLAALPPEARGDAEIAPLLADDYEHALAALLAILQ